MTPLGAAAAAGAASPATRARSSAPARPRVAPPRPRRVSGPSRPPVRPPARPPAKRSSRPSSRAQAEYGLVPGLLGALDGVSRSGALDRLIRGRIWIGVITFALIGIVTLQLLVLQLNASIGRSLVREAQLQRANATLSIESSELAGGERVEAQAAHLGMQLVAPGALRFLTGNPRADIARAAATLKAPVHAAASSPEAGATPPAAGTGTAAPASATPTEPSPSQSTSPTGESGSSETAAGAPSSAGVSPSASSTSSATSATGASTSSEPPSGAAVAQAGGVGSGQPNGGG